MSNRISMTTCSIHEPDDAIVIEDSYDTEVVYLNESVDPHDNLSLYNFALKNENGTTLSDGLENEKGANINDTWYDYDDLYAACHAQQAGGLK